MIAKNAGVNGSVVSEKVTDITLNLHSCTALELSKLVDKTYLYSLQVLANDNVKFGYNAATGKYEDLMVAGIIDPTKVSFSQHTTLFAERFDDKDLHEHE